MALTGAWLGVLGEFAAVPIVASFGVGLWVAGFDIIYACLDIRFDRENGVYSIPARFGQVKALAISKLCYSGAVMCFALTGMLAGLGLVYYMGLAVIASLLYYEHQVVRPDDISKMDMAFTTMNGVVSMAFFAFTAFDLAI